MTMTRGKFSRTLHRGSPTGFASIDAKFSAAQRARQAKEHWRNWRSRGHVRPRSDERLAAERLPRPVHVPSARRRLLRQAHPEVDRADHTGRGLEPQGQKAETRATRPKDSTGIFREHTRERRSLLRPAELCGSTKMTGAHQGLAGLPDRPPVVTSGLCCRHGRSAAPVHDHR